MRELIDALETFFDHLAAVGWTALGIAVRITVGVLRLPEAVRTLLAAFDSTDAAGEAVSHVIAAGILPAAIEMMDALTIEAAEAAVACGYPAGAGAVLIVELDGVAPQVLEDSEAVERICREAGATRVKHGRLLSVHAILGLAAVTVAGARAETRYTTFAGNP